MALKVSLEDFLGVDEIPAPSAAVIAAKMLLDFESDVFDRLKELGLTQKDLADRMGLRAATISKTLSTGSNPTIKTIAKIAEALGCTVASPALSAWDGEEQATSSTRSVDSPKPLDVDRAFPAVKAAGNGSAWIDSRFDVDKLKTMHCETNNFRSRMVA